MAAVEVTLFTIRAGEDYAFREAVSRVLPILCQQTEGFRKSSDFADFVAAFRSFLDKPAEVSHFQSDMDRY